jgi:hypothetical protein
MAIDERLERTIARVTSWPELNQLEKNIKDRGGLNANVEAALTHRSTRLGIEYILHETGLSGASLSGAEEKIIAAIGEYAAILRRDGKYPGRTLQQIKRRGLLDAAEISVCKKKPTRGYEVLADANLEDLSYERIVLDHPAEFSARAVWFSRRTLGLENESEKPPAATHSDINVRTGRLLDWLMERSERNGWTIPTFTNSDAAAAIGLGALSTYGRVHGNIQSRVDYACYLCDLPPLGCAAAEPFEKAWGQDGRSWAFQVGELQRAAQERIWSREDFQRIKVQVVELPGIAYLSWREALSADEQKVRVWASRWAKAASSSSTNDQRHLYRLPIEVLEQATPEFIWQAAQRYIAGETAPQFGPSTDFDLIVDGNRLPPKAVFGMALSMATGGQEMLPKHFTGGEGSACFRLLREAGFSIIPKDSTLIESEAPDAPEQEWAEGSYRLVPHWKRERAAGLSKAKKAQYRRLHGKLTCERCGFDPVQVFGSDIGEACIEVHHAKVQVSEMQPGHTTSLDDLQCLCANCHRFIHRQMAATGSLTSFSTS